MTTAEVAALDALAQAAGTPMLPSQDKTFVHVKFKQACTPERLRELCAAWSERDALRVEVERLRGDGWHYWRECHACGHCSAAYLHCAHDGIQSHCVKCGARLTQLEGECSCEMWPKEGK